MRKGQVVFCNVTNDFGVFQKMSTLDQRVSAVDFASGPRIVSTAGLRPITIDEMSRLCIRYVVNQPTTSFGHAVSEALKGVTA